MKRTPAQSLGITPTVDDRPTTIELDARQLATVLVALRSFGRPDEEEIPAADLAAIASNCGAFEPLSCAEIDALCERINQ